MTSLPASSPMALATSYQRRAADPALSVWVSASAGSGKTKVLRDRVLHLLLDDARPERILCLTFTKAGAAEMSNRVATTLAEWASIPEAALQKQLKELLGDVPLTDYKAKARGLFAKVLDAPGGMRIETIHAFCQSLLRRFPLEAGIAPHFRLIEEQDSAALLAEAREDMLAAAREGGNAALSAALTHLADRAGEFSSDLVMRELLGARGRLLALQQRMGSVDGYRHALARLLRIHPDATRQSALEEASRENAFDGAGLRAAIAGLEGGKKTDVDRATRLAVWLSGSVAQRVASFDDYIDIFIKKSDGELRKALATKDVIAAMPTIDDVLRAEGNRLLDVIQCLNAIEILADSTALLTLGLDLMARFRRQKSLTAALDFDDLILGTRDLLARPGIAPWVLYKLDGGIDHILIDEGQDTSPAQWDILKSIAAELIAGKGTERQREDRPRSIFAVGDFKQSIFSFQGAEPRAFLDARDHFAQQLDRSHGRGDTRTPFENVDLNVSFRSSPAVLSLVDQVFTGPARQGVIEPGADAIRHLAARGGAAGLVEAWPLSVPLPAPLPLPWSPPAIDTAPTDPITRLAEQIATRIGAMISGGDILPARGRPVRAGDFLVLVRSRNAFVPALVKALKARSIEVSGIDRLKLLSELAVRDVLAFLDFLLLPEDDLNLAALLKSPLIGLDEAALFELCVARGGRSLWEELRSRVGERPAFATAADLLQHYLASAQHQTPYELIADVLSAGGLRRKLHARLGLQVSEALDELLNLALAFEANHTPSLQGFRHWLDVSEAEVKRELSDDGGGQVRIMTVHGSKGLQAPIVFLAEQRRQRPNRPGLFWLESETDIPVWVARSGLDVAATAAARADVARRNEEEENRLLYVALTRAEDRLYVCGWRGERNQSQPSWHDHVSDALTEMLQDGAAIERQAARDWQGDEGWEGDWLRLTTAQEDAAQQSPSKHGLAVNLDIPFQDWALLPAQAEPDPPRPLIPSRPSSEINAAPDDSTLLSPLGRDQGFRFQRGLVIHKLFQLLPDLAPAERRMSARRWLDHVNRASGLNADAAMLDTLLAEVMAVLDDPRFAHLFVPGSRAEVPIVAEIVGPDGRSEVVSGQIDRLVVTTDSCYIVDFKSNRPPAMQPEHVSPQYLRQLALYRATVSKIYPSHAISCYLLWSAEPRLMEIPDRLLRSYA
ncbi:double-strand break repair helicase AddA [Dongia rigui]|uniref:DNA 3'-5' helicase n=1 Tax=Dongia rigui TaxID=940149 RepID=A0ABU5DV33_9PROT|nr:double-strand break repair helicase AddA [Dongia rigui]MDY0870832.1 double-strand break repair helicase AddA [Dongia rigui]